MLTGRPRRAQRSGAAQCAAVPRRPPATSPTRGGPRPKVSLNRHSPVPVPSITRPGRSSTRRPPAHRRQAILCDLTPHHRRAPRRHENRQENRQEQQTGTESPIGLLCPPHAACATPGTVCSDRTKRSNRTHLILAAGRPRDQGVFQRNRNLPRVARRPAAYVTTRRRRSSVARSKHAAWDRRLIREQVLWPTERDVAACSRFRLRPRGNPLHRCSRPAVFSGGTAGFLRNRTCPFRRLPGLEKSEADRYTDQGEAD